MVEPETRPTWPFVAIRRDDADCSAMLPQDEIIGPVLGVPQGARSFSLPHLAVHLSLILLSEDVYVWLVAHHLQSHGEYTEP